YNFEPRQFLDRYCATCHNENLKSGGLSLVQVDLSRAGSHPELWGKVVRKLHTGVMPPPKLRQPSEAERRAVLTWLGTYAGGGVGRQGQSRSHRNAPAPQSN